MQSPFALSTYTSVAHWSAWCMAGRGLWPKLRNLRAVRYAVRWSRQSQTRCPLGGSRSSLVKIAGCACAWSRLEMSVRQNCNSVTLSNILNCCLGTRIMAICVREACCQLHNTSTLHYVEIYTINPLIHKSLYEYFKMDVLPHGRHTASSLQIP